jgi:hypothetical protein
VQVIRVNRLTPFNQKRVKGESNSLCAKHMKPSTAKVTEWSISPQD